MHKVLMVVIALLGLALPGAVYHHFHKERPVVVKTAGEKIETFPIKTVRVISGHEYNITLQDGRLVRACLPVVTVPEAKQEVVRILHAANSAPATLVITHRGETAFADIQYGEVSLTGYLKEKKLTFDYQCQQPLVVWESPKGK